MPAFAELSGDDLVRRGSEKPCRSPLALCFLEARFGRLTDLSQFWNALLGDHPLTPGLDGVSLSDLVAKPLADLHGYLGRPGDDALVDLIVCDGSAAGQALRRPDLEREIDHPVGIDLAVWSQGGGPQSAFPALHFARSRLHGGSRCVLLAAAEIDRGVVVGLVGLPVALAHGCPTYAVLEEAPGKTAASVTIGTFRRPDPLAPITARDAAPASAWHWRQERHFFVSQGFSALVPLLLSGLILSERVIPPCSVQSTADRPPLPSPYLADQADATLHADVLLFGGADGEPIRMRSVAESKAVAPGRCTAWPSEPFTLAAPSKALLLAKISAAVRTLTSTTGALSITQLARGLRSEDGAFRLGFFARDRQECLDRLRHAADRIEGSKRRAHFERLGFHCTLPGSAAGLEPTGNGIAFMAPGIGSAYPGVLRGQAVRFPAVRQRLERFAMQTHPQAARLGEKLYGGAEHDTGVWSDLDWTGAVGSIVVLALEPLVRRLGLTPDVRLGFSNGEMAALLAARALKPVDERPLEALLWNSVELGQALARQAGLQTGKMVAVHLIAGGRELLTAQLRQYQGRVFLAIDASPRHVIVFGLEPQIDRVVDLLSEAGHICLPLPINRPFHTELIEGDLESLERLLAGLARGGSQVPVWSCARNAVYPQDSAQVTSLVRDSITGTVRFREALETLHQNGVSTFLEIGANAQLSGYARDTLKGRAVHIAALDRHSTDGVLQVLDVALYLFTHGFKVDIDALAPDRAERIDPGRVQGRSSWSPQPAARPPRTPTSIGPSRSARLDPLKRLDRGARSEIMTQSLATTRTFIASQERVLLALIKRARRSSMPVGADGPGRQPSLFARVRSLGDGTDTECTLAFEPAVDVHLDHHRLGRVPEADAERPERPLAVLAMVMTLEFMAQAGRRHLARSAGELAFVGVDNLVGARWVKALPGRKHLALRVSQLPGGSHAEVALQARLIDTLEAEPGGAIEAASGRVVFGRPESLTPVHLDGAALTTPWTAEEYNRFALFHGPAYRCLEELKDFREDGVEFTARVPDQRGLVHGVDHAQWLTPATLLDVVPQSVAFWLSASGLSWFTAFPVNVSRYRQITPLPAAGAEVGCRVRIRRQGDTIVADACLFDPDQRVFARIDGLKIVVYRMYQPLLARLYWREGSPLLSEQEYVETQRSEVACELPAQLDTDLRLGGGIFASALAQVVLTVSEQAQWLRAPAGDERRLRALKVRLLAKEAVIAWCRQFGASSPDHLDFSVLIESDDSQRVALRCAEPVPLVAGLPDQSLQITVVEDSGTMRATARPV